MAVEWGWLTHRPAKIIRFKEDEGRIAYLTTEEAARLREAAKADANPQTYAFVVVGLETGMRRMEILSIRKEHVHLGRRMIYIPHAKAGAREQPERGSRRHHQCAWNGEGGRTGISNH